MCGMNATEAVEYQWPYLLRFLPNVDVIERSAAELGAFRRHRGVPNATALLRLALVYGSCGYSLRGTAAWAEAANVAHVSDVALLQRFRAAADWMLFLLAQKLASRVPVPEPPPERGFRVHLIDATAISKPGSSGTDWRVHLSFDLSNHRIRTLEITDRSGGESLRRFAIGPGELAVADRGYATRAGFASVLAQGGSFLVRLPWSNVPLESVDGQAFDLFHWLRSLPEAAADQIGLRVRLPNGKKVAVRLVAIRKSEVAAERTRAKVLRNQSKQGEKVDIRSLEAAGYVMLLTNLTSEQLSAAATLELYRFRWQIELCFKQLKTILQLDRLPAKDPRLAITVIAAKLLGALVIDDFTARYVSFFPWGYPATGASTLVLASA